MSARLRDPPTNEAGSRNLAPKFLRAYLGNPISMQIEDREPVAPLEALNAPDPVLPQHEHPQVDEGVDVGDEVEAIVVEVEEDEAVRRVEVLHALDEVVLEAQQSQARLGLENGDS